MTQLLVSTPLHVFVVDTNHNQASILRTGDGYYYGITHKNGQFALSHSGGYIKIFESNAITHHSIKHLLQPHQIEWVENNILVTNTGKNCLSVFNQHGKLIRDIYLNDIKFDNKDGDRTANHFNSVHKNGNRVLILAHNYDRFSEIYELSWPDLELIEIKVTKICGAHNIWVGELGIILCDSMNGALYSVNNEEIFWQMDSGKGMARGLAVSEEYLYVGSSIIASRNERIWKTGVVWVVDRKSLKTINKIVIPGSGEVEEIRLLDELDECHNGEIISSKNVSSIKMSSPIISLALRIRQKYPHLQRNFWPISFSVRAAQTLTRWSIYRQ